MEGGDRTQKERHKGTRKRKAIQKKENERARLRRKKTRNTNEK